MDEEKLKDELNYVKNMIFDSVIKQQKLERKSEETRILIERHTNRRKDLERIINKIPFQPTDFQDLRDGIWLNSNRKAGITKIDKEIEVLQSYYDESEVRNTFIFKCDMEFIYIDHYKFPIVEFIGLIEMIRPNEYRIHKTHGPIIFENERRIGFIAPDPR